VVSTEHAQVIAEATRRLPAGLSGEQVAAVEQALVQKARVLDPRRLRKAARRAIESIEPDPAVVDEHEESLLQDEEGRALERARLTLHDNGDGTTSGHFTVPTLAGSILSKVLDAMTSPRRGRMGATRAQAGDQALDRDWAHERGRAFVELLEHLPTDHLHAKTAAAILVRLDLGSLRGQLKAAGLDTDERISAAQARRLACGAGLVPAVLDGPSMPLDVGRSKRLFTDTQRTALGLSHSTCAADGCERPFAWCDLHHLEPWSRGGTTDLHNAVPRCAASTTGGSTTSATTIDDPRREPSPSTGGREMRAKCYIRAHGSGRLAGAPQPHRRGTRASPRGRGDRGDGAWSGRRRAASCGSAEATLLDQGGAAGRPEAPQRRSGAAEGLGRAVGWDHGRLGRS
jgi:hypothetical protein